MVPVAQHGAAREPHAHPLWGLLLRPVLLRFWYKLLSPKLSSERNSNQALRAVSERKVN